MNQIRLKHVLMLAGIMLFASCTRNEETVIINGGGGSSNLHNWIPLSGNITSDKKLLAGKEYLLKGVVRVKAPATLTIPAGITIYADAATENVSSLVIEQGAKIDAKGKPNNPIVFTSSKLDNPAPGDWGGIVLVGKAKINRSGGKATGELEKLPYGGTDDTDNSGTLSYVRVEYTGHKFDDEHEYNAFSFYSVGSGTTVDHLQSYYGDDDGFEFFGGTVNVKYLVSTASADDSFDWTDGWRGKGQFLLAQQSAAEGDHGIEADNLADDPSATPISHPILSNVTLIGANDGGDDNRGAHFRVGSRVTLVNSFITGFPKLGIEVEGTPSNEALKDGKSVISNNLIIDDGKAFAYTTKEVKDKTQTTISSHVNLADEATYKNYISTNLPKGLTISLEGNYVKYSIDNNNMQAADLKKFKDDLAKDPTTLVQGDSFFKAVDYVGAIKDKNNDWTQGWTKSL